MKKIALFKAALLLCAGMAFAQSPVKKSNDSNTEKKEAPANNNEVKKTGCGHCPHHSQCGKTAQTTTTNEKSCCDKKADNKSCNKEGKKSENGPTNNSKSATNNKPSK